MEAKAATASVDRPTMLLRVVLAATIAISVVHYADNTIRYDVYTGGESSYIKQWMIPVSWALFTAAGVAGYVFFRHARWTRAAVYLAFSSIGGLVDLGHFTAVSPSDFDAYQLVFIFLDFVVGGLVLFGFVVWVTQTRVSLARRTAA